MITDYVPRSVQEILHDMIMLLPVAIQESAKQEGSNIRTILESVALSVHQTEARLGEYFRQLRCGCSALHQEHNSSLNNKRQPLGRPAAPWKLT